MKKIVLTCGIIAGFITTAWMFYAMISPPEKGIFEMGMVYGYAAMLLAFSLIFVGVKNYRDKHLGGQITFGKAFLTGLYITLVASTMYVLVWLIYYYNFAPDFMEQYTTYTIEQQRAKGVAESEIQVQVAEMAKFTEMYKNPLFIILLTYAEIVPVGLLISLIAALVLKRKPRQADTAMA